MPLIPTPTLMPGEQLIHTASPSWWKQAPLLCVGALLLPIGGLGLVPLLCALWRQQGERVWVTSARVIWQRGILSRRTLDILRRRIEVVQVTQTLQKRMMNIGDVQISSGSFGCIRLIDVAMPFRLRAAIQTPGAQ